MENIYQILILLVCYSLLNFLFLWIWKMKSHTLISLKVQNGDWVLLHIRHAGGIIIMLALPLLLLKNIPKKMVNWPKDVNDIQVIALMIAGLVLLIISAKASEKIKDCNPVVNKRTRLNAAMHMIFRTAFLVSYEWFFRGCILMICVSIFGIIPAIIINIGLYALIHSMNGKREFLGSVPFGLMLCVFTLWWQTVWPAVLLHLLLSSSYESVILHPFFGKPSKISI